MRLLLNGRKCGVPRNQKGKGHEKDELTMKIHQFISPVCLYDNMKIDTKMRCKACWVLGTPEDSSFDGLPKIPVVSAN